MSVKKINKENDEIDISQILKKWWRFRKIVIFGTIIFSLISTLTILIADKVHVNKKQVYITAVIKSDLGDKTSLIMSAFKSRPYITETLKKINLDIDPSELEKYLIFKKNTHPLTEDLKNQILLYDEKKLRSLALTNNDISKIIQNLNYNSKELITIQLYHKNLYISATQAKNLIVSLSKTINDNLILRSYRGENTITLIQTTGIKTDFMNENEQITRLSNIINSAQNNISKMKSKYISLLKNYDLENLSTRANISQKLLYEISKKLGNTITIDTLDVSINQNERDIQDLKNSLEYLYSQTIKKIRSSTQSNALNESFGNITQLDNEIFNKILSIGSTLNLNSFRLDTVRKIQDHQKEKSILLHQKELLNLPYTYDFDSIDLDKVIERVVSLAKEVNKVSSQLSNMTEPKSAFQIIKNPELIILNSRDNDNFIKSILMLTILSFLIISVISILIPAKKS